MHQILYEDDYFIAINKPPHVTVTRAESVKELTLEDYLLSTYTWASQIERGGIVHRLDKDTSGVILVAKTEVVKTSLQKFFHDRLVHKMYIALVHGTFDSMENVVRGAIARNPKNREKFAVLDDGREAVTAYKVSENFLIDPMILLSDRERITKKEKQYFQAHAAAYALVHCFPETGRTHQIRVHMQHIGHPLVSDATYTNRKLYRLDTTWCPRHFLHASTIRFPHPISGSAIEITAPLATDLESALAKISSIVQS